MTKIQRTIALLRRGWLTSLESAQRGGNWSLSQRVGELCRENCKREDGKYGPRYVIADRWQRTSGGSRVKAWKIVKDYKKGCA